MREKKVQNTNPLTWRLLEWGEAHRWKAELPKTMYAHLQVVSRVAALQYSCLEKSMDRGTWWATVHWITHKESDTTEGLTLPLFFV